MDVLVLIDRLEELVEEARSFPGFGNTAIVDRDAAFDVIDQMRQTIPEELKQARWIVKERQAMLDEARSESDRIIRQSQEEAEKITSEEEVLKRAESFGRAPRPPLPHAGDRRGRRSANRKRPKARANLLRPFPGASV